MRRGRLVWRIYFLFCLMGVAAFVLMSVYLIFALKRIHLNQVVRDLAVRAQLAAEELSKQPQFSVDTIDSFCKKWGRISRTRFTVILPDGTVVGDTQKDPAVMENHRYRPEVIQALAGHTGSSVRFSHTLRRHLVYVAVPLQQDNRLVAVVRAAVPADTVAVAFGVMRGQILIGVGLAAVFWGLLAIAISRFVARPLERIQSAARRLAEGDLDARVFPEGSEEAVALAEALNRMAEQLQDRIALATRQQQELEAVFSSMREGVIALDTDLRVLHMNESARRCLGVYYPDCSGLFLWEVVRNSEFVRAVQDIREHRHPREWEISFPANGVTERHFQVRSTELVDKEGTILGLVLVMNDITRLKQLEMMQRRFVADVSHELKTPLTAISGALETLMSDEAMNQGQRGRFLAIVRRQTDRMRALAEDLLSLAALEYEAQRGAIKLVPGPAAEPVRRAISLYTKAAAKKGIRILEELDDTILVAMNAQLLEQAVGNLLDNAIKYSTEGKYIHVSVCRSGHACEIRVRDEGIGIPAEHLPHLFERFYRVDKSRSRELGGTGLGLAIVKHIAIAHHGRVFVESTPGKGSLFVIQLPLQEEETHQ